VGLSTAKRLTALVVSIVSLGACAPGLNAAQAETPAHTDVMFVFDTTGSMGGALTEAKEEIQEAMNQVTATLPDAQFGLAEVGDYGFVSNGSPFEYGDGSGQAWTLLSPISTDQSGVIAKIAGLTASGGGDSPEAYGRGLFETATNPAVGWRSGARGIIVLIADDVPHDDELNQGIPEEFWAQPTFDTGVDPGPDNTVGTPDDIDWQAALQRLNAENRPLEYVDYQGDEEYVPYWQFWAGVTGGSVISVKEEEEKTLGSKLVEAVKSGATLPPCPAGQTHDSSGKCVPIPPPPAPPSNNFKIEPRISCAKGCYVVSVKIVFDSAGNVISESVLDEEAGASSVASMSLAPASKGKKKAACGKAKGGKACKSKPLIKRSEQVVVAGSNTLQLQLTAAAKQILRKKGKVALKVKFTFTPSGGTAHESTQTFVVKAPVKSKGAGKAHHH
jgi:hypothetical protein